MHGQSNIKNYVDIDFSLQVIDLGLRTFPLLMFVVF